MYYTLSCLEHQERVSRYWTRNTSFILKFKCAIRCEVLLQKLSFIASQCRFRAKKIVNLSIQQSSMIFWERHETDLIIFFSSAVWMKCQLWCYQSFIITVYFSNIFFPCWKRNDNFEKMSEKIRAQYVVQIHSFILVIEPLEKQVFYNFAKKNTKKNLLVVLFSRISSQTVNSFDTPNCT